MYWDIAQPVVYPAAVEEGKAFGCKCFFWAYDAINSFIGCYLTGERNMGDKGLRVKRQAVFDKKTAQIITYWLQQTVAVRMEMKYCFRWRSKQTRSANVYGNRRIFCGAGFHAAYDPVAHIIIAFADIGKGDMISVI